MAGPKNQIPFDQFTRLRTRSRGFLPHWEVEGATYFVTYRLFDSLPREVIERLRREHRTLSRRAFAISLDRELDEGRGAAYLRDNRIAAAVAENLNFHRKRYELEAWCVMPNHVHVVMTPFSGEVLSDILHSWKSYTTHQAKRILGVRRFWAREYYDHIVRSDRELNDTIAYVRCNPAKAGLVNWPWVG
jgi:REP element-mobilizing transposase RayT